MSAKASELKIANDPPKEAKECLKRLVNNVLDPAREAYGAPVSVSSGYRSPALNKAVGGEASSQHLKGQAADLTCANNAKLFAILYKQGRFDQLIWEHGTDKQPSWVHVSYNEGRNRREVRRKKRLSIKCPIMTAAEIEKIVKTNL